MDSRPAPIELTHRGDAGSQEFTDAMDVLDRSGMAYRIRDLARGERGTGLRLTWGHESISSFSRRQLVDFLWAHGARFEDS